MIFFRSKKNIAIAIYGLYFLYQMIGVMVHKQYGFGFFYWPVQLYLMLVMSIVYIYTNTNEVYHLTRKLIPLNLYILTLFIFQIVYIFNYDYRPYIPTDELIKITTDMLVWYIIVLVMATNYGRIINLLKIKVMSIIYVILLILFFSYIIKLNAAYGTDASRAFWIGANFPTVSINKYLSNSGYVKGFHLYFSMLFAMYSFAFIGLLQKHSYKGYSLFLFLLSFYILFLASGRGVMVGYFLVSILYFFRSRKAFLFFILIVVTVYFSGILDILEENNKRLYEMITLDVEGDVSGAGRLHQLEMNLSYIYDNWITGGIRSHYIILGRGEYIHSMLSALQEYGILGFGLLVAIILKSVYMVITVNKKSLDVVVAKAVITLLVIQVILFKNVPEIKMIIPLLISCAYLNSLKEKYYES